MWQTDVTTDTSWRGWETTAKASWYEWVPTATTTSTSSTYYAHVTTLPGYAHVTTYYAPKPVKKAPEPEPCTEEELEDFLFGGA